MRDLLLHVEEIEDAVEVHCSRERSRAASKIIEEYLIPFIEKHQYQIPKSCRLHPDNDLFRDQEQHKIRIDVDEWKCGYCRKSFYEERYIDKHFEQRHNNLLNVSHGKCLADVCGALHCDHHIGLPQKTKCNPAASARNKHLCESIADSCFPVSRGPTSSRVHEFFLRQFCDAHTCTGKSKPFSRGRKKRMNILYIVISVLTMLLLLFFYTFIYLYQRGVKSGTQNLRRVSQSGRKKKPS
uniref:C2H2-type domain-containing protein n=1 Tax=Cannabis sativa TaxID=3483 RepID=A0A803QL98_CANSA